jgi:hypothetical protein
MESHATNCFMATHINTLVTLAFGLMGCKSIWPVHCRKKGQSFPKRCKVGVAVTLASRASRAVLEYSRLRRGPQTERSKHRNPTRIALGASSIVSVNTLVLDIITISHQAHPAGSRTAPRCVAPMRDEPSAARPGPKCAVT